MLVVGSEKDFLLQGCRDGIRADGRGCLDWRPISVETDVIASASGSARVKIGGTDVIVGIKADLCHPEPERPDTGRLQFSAECSACAGPELRARGAEALNASLTKVLERAFAPSADHGLDLSKLSIVLAKHCWVLNVDALVLGIDGSLADATSLAVKAALSDTRVPMVNVVEIEGVADGDPELEVDDDPEHTIQLDVSTAPVVVTVSEVDGACLTDLTLAEEACSGASVQAVVSEAGVLWGIVKQGTAALSADAMLAMVRDAQSCGPTLSAQLTRHLTSAAAAMQH